MIGRLLARPAVAQWLWRRAQRTPYLHLAGYMERWWLFNGYDQPHYRAWLPSIRMHHILRADNERHLHDHPWNARTFILKGNYLEERQDGVFVLRVPGDTATLKFGEYHRIASVSTGGVWTLFVTWRKQGTWGFLVDGQKVPHREYLQQP